MALTDREREARIRERLDREEFERQLRVIRGHIEGNVYTLPVVESSNRLLDHDAAQRAEIERYREALDVITRFGAELSYADAFNEIQQIAHRALNDGEDDGESKN